MLPQPERDWRAPLSKKLPGVAALAAARALLRVPRSHRTDGDGDVLVAFGNLGDHIRMLNVASLFDFAPSHAFLNPEGAAALRLFHPTIPVETVDRHGVDALAAIWRTRRLFRRAVVPHPFVTQPFALLLSRAAAGRVVAATTGEFAPPRCDATFLQMDTRGWREAYASFFAAVLDREAVRHAPEPHAARWSRERASRSARVVCHLASATPEKALPVDVAERVVRALRGRGYDVVLAGGHADRPVLERIACAAPARIAAGLPLADVARLLAESRAFVGVESSVMHLADAVGTPSVVAYTVTDPAANGPFFAPFEAVAVCEPILRSALVLSGRLPLPRPDWSDVATRIALALERVERRVDVGPVRRSSRATPLAYAAPPPTRAARRGT